MAQLAACMDEPVDYQNKTGNLEFNLIYEEHGASLKLTKFDTPYGGEYASIFIKDVHDTCHYNLSEKEFNRLRQMIG